MEYHISRNRITFLSVILWIVFFLGSSTSVQAQSDYNLPTLPSPTQAGIASYGEVPVNIQTGKVSYQVPLHTVAYKDLSVPIFLSYNVDGIKLDAPVSWAGTGWDLMAGGSINRVKKGKPDEWGSGYYYMGDDPDFLNFVEFSFTGSCTGTDCDLDAASYALNTLGQYEDTQQDIFYYNIGGMNGKFVLEPGNTTAHTIPMSNTKIEVDISSNNIGEFTITTPDGVKYTFGEGSNSEETVDDPTQDYITTWYLTSIESPIGNEITLAYKAGDTQDVYSYGFEADYSHFFTHGAPDDIQYDDYSTTKYSYKQLSYISTPLEEVTFIETTTGASATEAAYQAIPRERIESIEVYSETGDETIKVIEFDHDFTGNDRMFLDEVAILNGNNEQLEAYSFEYYEKASLPGDRSNMGIDRWGYFNNKHTNNSSLETYIPTMALYYAGDGQTWGPIENFREGANRSVNSGTVHYGALKRINYPTGGYTEIEYEPNDYSEALYGLELPESKMEERNLRTVSYFDTFWDPGDVLTHEFTLSTDATFDHLDFNYFKYTIDLDDGCGGEYDIKFYEENGSSDILLDSWDDFSGQFELESFTYPNDDYYFTITAPGSLCNNDPVLASGNVTISEKIYKDVKYGPGVRVSKTTSHDGVSSDNDVIKTYEYGFDDGGTYTSYGVVFQDPEYFFEFPSTNGYVQSGYGSGGTDHDNFYAFMSNPVASLGGDSRGFMGYKQVKVMEGENGDSGYTIHYFNLGSNGGIFSGDLDTIVKSDYVNTHIGNKEVFPAGPDISYKTVEARSIVYDTNDDVLYKKGSKVKFYDQTTLDLSTDDEVIKRFPNVGLYMFRPESKLFMIAHNYSMWQRPELDSVVVYNGSSTPQITETEYNYDDYGIQQLRTSTETNSNGDTRTTEYKYAHEEYSGMATDNMLSQPYSVTVKEGSTVLSRNWTVWDDGVTGASGVWMPDEYWSWDTGAVADDPSTSIAIKNVDITEYDSDGNPISVIDAMGEYTKFYYGSNTSPYSQNGLNGVNGVYLTGIQKEYNGLDGAGCTSNDLCTSATYDDFGRVETVTDENGQTTEYEYDGFGRLEHSYSPTGAETEYEYYYSADGNGGDFSSSDPNYVKTEDITTGIESFSYLDGLGRQIQTQTRGGGKELIAGTAYNERGLPEYVSRPIDHNTSGYVTNLFSGTISSGRLELSYGSPIETYYDGLVGNPDANYAHTHTVYESSPLARGTSTQLPGSANRIVSTSYSLNTSETFTVNGSTWGTNELVKTVTTDPDGNETITYTDGWGRTIASGVNMNPSSDDALDDASDLITEFEYDERGNLVRVEDPRGLVTTYVYNDLGQLESKQLPDQTHPHQYRYDDKGRLRFHRDPNLDAASDYYYYTKYDDLDRPTEVGIRTSSNDFDDDADINNESFPTSSYTAYISYYYDGVNAYSGHTPNNIKGRLTRVSYKDPNGSYWGHKWYSYNELGLVEWVIQAPAEPTSSKNVKIEYTYDDIGRLTRTYFNPINTSSDDHYFWYYYDDLGRLEEITSYGSNAESSALTEAEYTYFADGSVDQLILGGGAQTVDYDYTIQGWVDKINDPSSMGSDVFASDLYYELNGNINRQRWEQAAFSTSTYNYYYGYDAANRLTEACYGGSTCDGGAFDVTYGYLENGGLDWINREDGGSSLLEYDHVYESGTNKLDYVAVDGISGETQPVTKQFSHDASGNVTENRVQEITSTTYDWRNLPTQLVANSTTINYIYDAEGNRVRKAVSGGETTWYIRGADGQTIAAYDGSGNLLFLNILAGGQIIGQIEN